MSPDDEVEIETLEAIASDSWYARGVSGISARYCAQVFARHWKPGRCLEMGPAEGVMTGVLVEHFDDLTAVDGSSRFCHALSAKFPNVRVVNQLFEAFQPDGQFDTIVLGHVLEHVSEPVSLLRRAKEWLADGGRILAAVPNARSIHRQAAVCMRILSEEHALNDADCHHGHRRVYDPESFRQEFLRAGLEVHVFGGYWMKPLSNLQLDATWTPEMLAAFMQLGERYPDIAAEIYVVACA